jgi:TRAP-type C4-dicarboxylate transport system permease small subunit
VAGALTEAIMLKSLFKFEEGLVRVESWILVISVLLMLVLAGYTVFYRNVLIPWQNHLATSGPPVTAEEGAPESSSGSDDDGGGEGDDEEGFGGGFGGGFGDDGADQGTAEEDDEADGFGGGFGGGFGEDEPDPEPPDEDEEADEADDFGGGFGGGFGEDEESGEEGFGGGFGDEGDDAAAEASQSPQADEEPSKPEEPLGGPPPEGSLGAWLMETIDAVKFHWMDVLLRQLVIITGFLGAMLAARRRSHITVDALGNLIRGRRRHIVDAVTALVAAIVCGFLTISGWNLVEIGLEYPRQLMPYLEDWHFQLAFPIGWGLLTFHFLMRAVESTKDAVDDAEHTPPEELSEGDAI